MSYRRDSYYVCQSPVHAVVLKKEPQRLVNTTKFLQTFHFRFRVMTFPLASCGWESLVRALGAAPSATETQNMANSSISLGRGAGRSLESGTRLDHSCDPPCRYPQGLGVAGGRRNLPCTFRRRRRGRGGRGRRPASSGCRP